jgi:hypothetical protein
MLNRSGISSRLVIYVRAQEYETCRQLAAACRYLLGLLCFAQASFGQGGPPLGALLVAGAIGPLGIQP